LFTLCLHQKHFLVMAKVKIVHYTSKKLKDKTSPVLLRLTINRKVRNFSLPDNFHCLPNQWDKKNSCFKYNYPNYDKANKRLGEALLKARDICMDLNQKNNDQGFTHDEFTERFKSNNQRLMLFEYFDQIITRLEKAGKVGNKDVYLDTKRQFQNFFDGNDIEMKKVTRKHLNLFVEKCLSEGKKDTTIHYRLRTLRALFNKAKSEENLENYPFEKFDWSRFNLETEKRALVKDDLLKIYNHKLEPGQLGFDSRNYWLFSYFCYGLNFGDLAKLEPANIVNEDNQPILKYYRSKTRKLFKVPLNDYSLEILKHYQNSNFGKKYLFPILDSEIHKTPQQIRIRIQTALKKVNTEIREIAVSLGIKKHITSYTARHSFATILKRENIGTAIISEMMGHSSESVTQTYLDSFDNSTKTEAAKKLI
jgi:integrase/recombinase XerD